MTRSTTRGILTSSLILLLSSCLVFPSLASTETKQIIVDPSTGIIIESGEAVVPLYESTLRLVTGYYVTSTRYWNDMGNGLSPRITSEDIPDLGEMELQFWQNACCHAIPEMWTCPRDRSALELRLSVYDEHRYERLVLFTLAFRTAYEMGWADAAGVSYTGSSRAFVTQTGSFKILSIVRAIALLKDPYPCATDADFAVDVYVAIYPRDVDILLQARRQGTWP